MGLLSRCTTKMGMLKCYSLLDIPEICSVCLDLLLDSLRKHGREILAANKADETA